MKITTTFHCGALWIELKIKNGNISTQEDISTVNDAKKIKSQLIKCIKDIDYFIERQKK